MVEEVRCGVCNVPSREESCSGSVMFVPRGEK